MGSGLDRSISTSWQDLTRQSILAKQLNIITMSTTRWGNAVCYCGHRLAPELPKNILTHRELICAKLWFLYWVVGISRFCRQSHFHCCQELFYADKGNSLVDQLVLMPISFLRKLFSQPTQSCCPAVSDYRSWFTDHVMYKTTEQLNKHHFRFPHCSSMEALSMN